MGIFELLPIHYIPPTLPLFFGGEMGFLGKQVFTLIITYVIKCNHKDPVI